MITVYTVAFHGIEVIPIEIQVKIVRGIPMFTIVGMVDKTISESKERIRGAFGHMNVNFPFGKLIVNLSPSDIKKEGALYDLPIAVGILAAMGLLQDTKFLNNTIIIGELSLNGTVLKSRGILPAAYYAHKNNLNILISESSREEAYLAMETGENIITCECLQDIINNNLKKNIIKNKNNTEKKCLYDEYNSQRNFPEVIAYDFYKRICALALAGRHNILLMGPPGVGKSLLIHNMKYFQIPLNREKSIEVSSIYSTAGLLQNNSLITHETFRNPHHSLSTVAMCGGGTKCSPGEISLCHYGILFLDELSEYSSQVLNCLRQPLEDKKILISRANYSVHFPSNIQLCATMNPCKCGWYGDESNKCKCSNQSIMQYYQKISGPLLDRIDIKMLVRGTRDHRKKNEDSKPINYLKKIMQARENQCNRYEKYNFEYNSEIPYNMLNICNIKSEAHNIIEKFQLKNNISFRSVLRIYRLARTISDFDECEYVGPEQIEEAIFYNHSVYN